jgi:hypothetical protein
LLHAILAQAPLPGLAALRALTGGLRIPAALGLISEQAQGGRIEPLAVLDWEIE